MDTAVVVISIAEFYLWYIHITIWKPPPVYLAIGRVWIHFDNNRRFAWEDMDGNCVADIFMWYIRVSIWRKNKP